MGIEQKRKQKLWRKQNWTVQIHFNRKSESSDFASLTVLCFLFRYPIFSVSKEAKQQLFMQASFGERERGGNRNPTQSCEMDGENLLRIVHREGQLNVS